MAKAIDPKFANLLRDLECGICFHHVNDARLCPHCSKIFCEKCIYGWLNTSRDCPACRTPVERCSLMRGLSIDSIMGSIKQLLLADQDSIEDRCSRHPNQQLSMFCNACIDSICAKCFFSKEHAEHKGDVVPLDEAFETYQHKLKTAIDGFNERKEHIKTVLSKLQAVERRFKTEMELIENLQKESEALVSIEANPASMMKIVETDRLITGLPDESDVPSLGSSVTNKISFDIQATDESQWRFTIDNNPNTMTERWFACMIRGEPGVYSVTFGDKQDIYFDINVKKCIGAVNVDNDNNAQITYLFSQNRSSVMNRCISGIVIMSKLNKKKYFCLNLNKMLKLEQNVTTQ